MTKEVTALLAFCEGAHEVAFVRRLLKNQFDFRTVSWRFSEFPSPFNSLFKRNVERHAARDLSLDMAHKFYLPNRVLARDGHLALLFDAGGKHTFAPIISFLKDFLDLQAQARVFPEGAPSVVGRPIFLFLHDADTQGPDSVRSTLKQSFGVVGDSPWLSAEWDVDALNPVAATASDIASYVWADENGVGTLEDVMMPVLKTCDGVRCGKAEQCIDDLFTWGGDGKDPNAERAKRHKAIITLLGQREKPGYSQHVILDQTLLLKE